MKEKIKELTETAGQFSDTTEALDLSYITFLYIFSYKIVWQQ